MLHAIKPLFFNRGNQFAVVDDRRCRIAVICVYSENIQVRISNRGFQDPREVSGVEFLLALQTLSRPCWIATTVNDGVNVNGVSQPWHSRQRRETGGTKGESNLCRFFSQKTDSLMREASALSKRRAEELILGFLIRVNPC